MTNERQVGVFLSGNILRRVLRGDGQGGDGRMSIIDLQEPARRDEHEIDVLTRRIAELEHMVEHQRIMLKHQGIELVCYENDVDALVELICDMWKCLSAHIESAINDGGCGYPYSPQTRGCGEGCTVNGEDCSMSLIERRMRRLGIEVDE